MKEEKKVIELNLDDVLPNRFQPRIRFDESAINELAESIKEHGVIQPIVVRPIADKYEIIAGERRYKASTIAGMKTIPALVANLNDKESAEIALIENVQRQDLTPIEEAVSYKKILDMGYLTQNQLADKLGKDQSTVANKLRLLNLDEDVQEALLNEKISERHARSLLRLEQKDQRKLLKEIIEKRLTVRKTDEEINKILTGTSGVHKSVEPVSPVVEPTMPVIEQPKKVVDDLEVLDLGDFNSNQKEETMNDKDFNIPESPIINEPTHVNPGFMDVNRIEQNATNIFEEKPAADINNLLEPSSTPLTPEEPKVEEEPGIRPGKFFNILEDEKEEPVVPTSTFEVQGGFDTAPIMPEKVEEVSEIPTLEEKGTELPEIPTFQGSQPEDNTLPTTETLDLDDVTPVIPEIPAQPTGPITEPDYSFLEDLDLETPSVAPAAKSSVASDPTKITIPELSLEETIKVPETNTGNINEALAVVRECASKLEQMGYVVDTDEFDFSDMYQVIFKIEKK